MFSRYLVSDTMHYAAPPPLRAMQQWRFLFRCHANHCTAVQ